MGGDLISLQLWTACFTRRSVYCVGEAGGLPVILVACFIFAAVCEIVSDKKLILFFLGAKSLALGKLLVLSILDYIL